VPDQWRDVCCVSVHQTQTGQPGHRSRVEPPKNFAVERATGWVRLGPWYGPYYDIITTDSLEAISARWGNFTLVDGNVVLVRSSSGIIDVNFGRR